MSEREAFSLTYFLIIMTYYLFWWCMQVNLVDWLKMMVGSRRSEEVVDPNIEIRPSTRALKRALLTALRCVDPDSDKRPKMGQVVRMLESEEYPISREVRILISFLVNNTEMRPSIDMIWLGFILF